MSDRIPAVIDIGGELPEALVEDFIQAIADDGPSLDWGDHPFEPKSAKDLMEACTEGVLSLKDDEARQGVFSAIEAFCAENGLEFDRQSDAKWEFNGEIVRHRPEGAHEMYCTQDGAPCVRVADIQGIFGDELQKLRKCAAFMLEKFKLLCGLHVRPLAKFKVVE